MSEINLNAFPWDDTLTADQISRRGNIIAITPPGYDPVLYWHQAAQDAIQSGQKAQERAERFRVERDQAKHDLENYINRLIHSTACATNSNPVDVSKLVTMAQQGEIDLNISVFVTKNRSESEGSD